MVFRDILRAGQQRIEILAVTLGTVPPAHRSYFNESFEAFLAGAHWIFVGCDDHRIGIKRTSPALPPPAAPACCARANSLKNGNAAPAPMAIFAICLREYPRSKSDSASLGLSDMWLTSPGVKLLLLFGGCLKGERQELVTLRKKGFRPGTRKRSGRFAWRLDLRFTNTGSYRARPVYVKCVPYRFGKKSQKFTRRSRLQY